MTDPNKITQHIEQILRKERQDEEESNFISELIYKLVHKNKTKSENEKTIFEMKEKFESLEKENDNRHCDLELLKIELESWEKPLKDAQEVHKGVLKQMDDLQQKTWNNQRRFCDSVAEFIDSHGTRATMNKNFNEDIRGQMAAALSGMDAENICKDNKKTLKREAKCKELESEISKNKTLIQDLKTKLFNVQALNRSSQKEYEDGLEFTRLRNALKFSRDEASKYYTEMDIINYKIDKNAIHPIPKEKNQTVTKQRMITDFIKASDGHNVNNISIHSVEYSENEMNEIYSEEIQYNNMATTSNNSVSYEVVEMLTPGKNAKKFQQDLYVLVNSYGNDANKKANDMKNILNNFSSRDEEISFNNVATTSNNLSYKIFTPGKNDKQFKRDLYVHANNDGYNANKKKADDKKNIPNNFSSREDVYKEINLMKEKAKASGKRQIKKFNLKMPRK